MALQNCVAGTSWLHWIVLKCLPYFILSWQDLRDCLNVAQDFSIFWAFFLMIHLICRKMNQGMGKKKGPDINRDRNTSTQGEYWTMNSQAHSNPNNKHTGKWQFAQTENSWANRLFFLVFVCWFVCFARENTLDFLGDNCRTEVCGYWNFQGIIYY